MRTRGVTRHPDNRARAPDNYPTPRRHLQIQRGTIKTVFQDGTCYILDVSGHVTGVNNERDAESIFAVLVMQVLTLRQGRIPLLF